MRSLSAVVSTFAFACGPSLPGNPDAAVPDAGGSDAGAVDAGPPDPSTWRWSLELLPVDDVDFVQVLAMSDDGAVLASAGTGEWDPTSQPVRLSPAGVESLPIPEANWGYAHGAHGGVTVGEWHWSPQHWSGGVRTELPVPEGWGSGVARAVNASGLIVGSYRDYDDSWQFDPGPRAAAWTDLVTFRELAHDGGPNALGAARDVNDSGVIAGWVRFAEGARAVKWSSVQAVASVMGVPEGAQGCEANAINTPGDIVGRCVFGSASRATWFGRDGSVTVLPSPMVEYEYAEALDVDDDGRIVGAARLSEAGARGVLWFEGTLIDLDARVTNPVGGFTVTRAVGIDATGRIAVQLSGGTPQVPLGVAARLVPVP